MCKFKIDKITYSKTLSRTTYDAIKNKQAFIVYLNVHASVLPKILEKMRTNAHKEKQKIQNK